MNRLIAHVLTNKNFTGASFAMLLIAISALWIDDQQIRKQLEICNEISAKKLEVNNTFHLQRTDSLVGKERAQNVIIVNRLISSYEKRLESKEESEITTTELRRKLALIERNLRSAKSKLK